MMQANPTRPPRILCRQRGWAILEMMVVIALLGLFATLLMQYMNLERKTIRATTQALTTATQFDSMLSRLRHDVWSATAVTLDDGVLTITPVRGSAVRWRVDADGKVRRDIDDAVVDRALNWNVGSVAVTFAPNDAGVEVHLASTGHDGSSTLVLVSQMMLATTKPDASSAGGGS